jgi:Protein of unknown function (DUF3037)
MQEPWLYEYAVIRVVPRVEREEFLNVGVIVYCARSKFLQVQYALNREKISAFAPGLDVDEVEQHLAAFQRISAGDPTAGPIALLPPAERFRWLTATRSTVVQSSKVHSGFCRQLPDEVRRLFEQMVK